MKETVQSIDTGVFGEKDRGQDKGAVVCFGLVLGYTRHDFVTGWHEITAICSFSGTCFCMEGMQKNGVVSYIRW
jgi:hypothetical protein